MSYENVSINFEIDDAKLISVNDQYMHPVRKTKRGRYVSYFAPSPYLKTVQAFYKEVLEEKITDEYIEMFNSALKDKSRGIKLEIIVGTPPEEFNRSDVSNFIKALEDCIVNRTKIDDSRNFEVSIKKRSYDNEGLWKVHITLSTVDKEFWD